MSAIFRLIRSIIQLIFGIIQLLLVLRVIFKLFGANASSIFVQWLYAATAPFIAPFRGIFPDWRLEGIFFVLEISTIFAAIFYMIIGTILSEFFSRLELIDAQRDRTPLKQ